MLLVLLFAPFILAACLLSCCSFAKKKIAWKDFEDNRSIHESLFVKKNIRQENVKNKNWNKSMAGQ